ncbi:MAG: fumarylacetoacetate hydrolase family protein [Methylobacteriaceae bacterium]|nr:fumarylacetoacetate hydrolase family protein [Methylobacteriaceae bacterium]MBV9393365.1 fumarylacetoacetate hydrolase family protein [Methylobacteriaceae bacterium]
MQGNRRSFLKATGLAAATVGLAAPQLAEAQAAKKTKGQGGPAGGPQAGQPPQAQAMPKNMSFTTLITEQGPGLGIRTEKGILNVMKAEADLRTGAPVTADDLIQGLGNLGALQTLVQKASASKKPYFVAEADAKFGPCVLNPEKIVCIGLNYKAHAEEAGEKLPPVPILFNKYNSALNAHGGTVAVSKEHAEKFDYEAELVAVIGKEARDVSEADALSYVFGYCNGHDLSARDLQMATTQWMVGKTGDGWGPIGPWLVSADQIDPDNLKIECLVNGEVRQSSNTKLMIFGVRKLVSYISKYMTLRPGDIIFTGTPNGVILGYPKEKQVWLKAGDKITTRIEKLGDLNFTLT